MASVTKTVWPISETSKAASNYKNMSLTLSISTTANVDTNTSTLDYILYITKTDPGASFNFGSQNTVNVKINGNTVFNTDDWGRVNMNDLPNNGTLELTSGQTTIAHNADGTKTISYYGYYEQPQYYSSYGKHVKYIIEGNLELDTIPRSGSVDIASSVPLDSPANITITPSENTAFTYTLWYWCGNIQNAVIASGLTYGQVHNIPYAWTPPLSLAHQAMSASTLSYTLYLDTMSGSTRIGRSSVKRTLTVPASVKPGITSIGIAEGNRTDVPEVPFDGIYIQGKSRFVVTVRPDLRPIQSGGVDLATIQSCLVTIGGTSYTATESSGEWSATSGVISTAGNVSVAVTLTDSRGRTTSGTTSATVSAYSSPSVGITAFRCDENGNEDLNGAYVNYNVTQSHTALYSESDPSTDLNPATVTAWYKKAGDSVVTLSGTSGIVPQINTDYTYTFGAKISDFWTQQGQEPQQTVAVGTAFVLMDFHNSGTGIAFGKVSGTSNLIDVNIPTKVNKGVVMDAASATLVDSFNALPNNSIGLIRAITSTSDKPSDANNLGILSYKYNDNYGAQLSVSSGGLSVRTKYNTWGNWAKLLTAADVGSKADVNSPTFTGTPTAPTAAAGTNNTQIATTAFVSTAIANAYPKARSEFSRGSATAQGGRVTVESGGYKQVGNIVFVSLNLKIADSGLTTADFWGLMNNFPKPVTYQALNCARYAKKGVVNAIMIIDGSAGTLQVATADGFALGDQISITGMYYTA